MGDEKVDVMMDEVMEVEEGDDEVRSLSDLPNFEKNFGVRGFFTYLDQGE